MRRTKPGGGIGNVTGRGLAGYIKDRYSLRTLRVRVALPAAANVINADAGIGAIGHAAALMIPIPAAVLMVVFTAVILALEIGASYRRYAKILRWLRVSLLAYPVTAFLARERGAAILRATVVPRIEFSAAFSFVITAVIGTTITPCMFVWPASQEAAENPGPQDQAVAG